MIAGRATRAGTQAFRDLHGDLPVGHWRGAGGLTLSSLGWGSYLGRKGQEAESAYEAAALAAVRGGVNVLDTASNYRDQASERDLGRAMAAYVEGGGAREHVLVTSKAGFLHGDAHSDLGSDWFQAQYVLDGTVTGADVVDTMHCMTPAYIRREVARSRENLGLDTIDVYFLHNPETQVAAGVPPDEVYARVEAAFGALEEAVDAGHIQVYGVATWDGLRVPPGHPAHLELVKLVHAAGQARMTVGGKASDHHFRAVELPVNLSMPEAATEATQPWRFGERTTLEIAREQGWIVLASAPLLQTRLAGRVPEVWREALGTGDDLETAFQFARSVPGVTSALVGMGDPAHVAANLRWCNRGPDEATVRTMLGSGWGHD